MKKPLKISIVVMLMCSLLTMSAFASSTKITDLKDNKLPKVTMETHFTDKISAEDKKYVIERDKLINEYGVEEAYSKLGYTLESKKTTDSSVYVVDPGGGGATPNATKSFPIGYNNRATLTISVYKK